MLSYIHLRNGQIKLNENVENIVTYELKVKGLS